MRKIDSDAFAASMTFGFNKSAAEYSFTKEDLTINKHAGIDIYNPTLENVEIFIEKYIRNEMGHIQGSNSVAIRTLIHPKAYNTHNSEHIDVATATISMPIGSKIIQIPLVLNDGQLEPPDVIQVDGQRVPYSRDNLHKVINGIKKWDADEREGRNVKGPGGNPFVGTEKAVNPATTEGFLGSVLNIRDNEAYKGARVGGNYYITASEKISELLEKTAQAKPLKKEHLKVLEQEFAKTALEEFKAGFEKVAAEVEKVEEDFRPFEKAKELDYKNAASLQNGQLITFPRIEGKEVVMDQAIIADCDGKKVVINTDGEVEFINKGENFLCLNSDRAFNVPKVEIKTLKEEDLFVAFNGDQLIGPYKVITKGTTLVGGNSDLENITPGQTGAAKIERLVAERINDFDKESLNKVNKPIFFLAGAKFSTLPLKEFEAKKKEELGLQTMDALGSFPKEIFATSPETKVIKIKGRIEGYLKNRDELMKFASLEVQELEKIAATEKNKVKVTLQDRQRKLYNVDVNYVDKTKQVFNVMEKNYRMISETEVRQILGLIGYNNQEIGEIMYKARNNPQATFALPDVNNVMALQNGFVKNVAQEKVKNVVKKMANPQAIAKSLAGSASMALITDAVLNSPDVVQEAVNQLSSFASEGKMLSAYFEKVAQEKESESSLDVAKLMSMSVILSEKTASLVSGKEMYPVLTDLSKEILESKDILGKVAFDLLDLKEKQSGSGIELVETGNIKSAIKQIDNLYKIACALRGE